MNLRWQRWLGVGVVVEMVPLALTGTVSALFLIPLAVTAAALLLSPRPLSPFPAWLENLLAPVVVAVVGAAGGLRFGVIRPVAHLLVLLAAIRLWGGSSPPRRKISLLLFALLGVAGVAASTHPLLALYLLVALGLVVLAVGDLLPRSLAAHHAAQEPRGAVPIRLVSASVVLALIVAIPLFLLFPRLRSPFAVAGVGGGAVSGFREAVALHQLGEIKASRRPMLRVRFREARSIDLSWLRFVGATLTHYRAGRWLEAKKRGEAQPPTHALGLGEEAELTLEQSSDRLFVPAATTGILPLSDVELWVDGSSAFRIPRHAEPPINYRVSFLPKEVLASPPGPDDLSVSVNREQLEHLARQATRGTSGETAKAKALETFLQSRYLYSTGTNAPLREDPVAWFLWTSRVGHCEFFASSMVLLLRTLGIPARLQTGFAGGQSLGGGEYLLRDANAHAWVLAYVDGRWQIFDPTPPEGQPGVEGKPGWLDLRAIWGNVEAFWDRWILTFSLDQQLQLFVAFWRSSRKVVVWVVMGLGVLVFSTLVFRRQKRPTLPSHKLSPLGRVLERLARKAGWSPEDFHRATPYTVLASLLPRLDRAQQDCLWLFMVHQETVFGATAPPPWKLVAQAASRVLRELTAASSVKDHTTNAPAPSSTAAKEPQPERPPGSDR